MSWMQQELNECLAMLAVGSTLLLGLAVAIWTGFGLGVDPVTGALSSPFGVVR